ncbi:MAG: hypothetical protein WC728_14680 [Elusimicrobiota bacterium]
MTDAEAAWMRLFNMIREQFPYSKMKEARVSRGAVVRYGRIQFTEIFGRDEEPPQHLLPQEFDGQWRRLRRLCEVLQECVIAEVHFTHGRPVSILFEKEGGDLSDPASRVRFPLARQQGGAKEVI